MLRLNILLLLFVSFLSIEIFSQRTSEWEVLQSPTTDLLRKLFFVDSENGLFSVSIIPFTQQVTNFHNFKIGTIVNIEFDVFGKYVQKLLEQYMTAQK